MKPEYKVLRDPEEFEVFRELLKASNLPADDLNFSRDFLVGYYEGNAMVGTGGLEVHGPFGLLRSLSVKMGIRGKSVGSAITERLLTEARERKMKAVYLLTETARGFFQKKGFEDVPRERVADEVRASTEFSHVCPSTAAVMVLHIHPEG